MQQQQHTLFPGIQHVLSGVGACRVWPQPCRSAPAGLWWVWLWESCSVAPGQGGYHGYCDSQTHYFHCDHLSSSPLPEKKSIIYVNNKGARVRTVDRREDTLAMKKGIKSSLMPGHKQNHHSISFYSSFWTRVACVCVSLSLSVYVCSHSSPLSSQESRPWSYYRHLPERPLPALRTTLHCSAPLACGTHTRSFTDKFF